MQQRAHTPLCRPARCRSQVETIQAMPTHRKQLATQEGIVFLQQQQMQQLQVGALAASLAEERALREQVAAMTQQLEAAKLADFYSEVGAGSTTCLFQNWLCCTLLDTSCPNWPRPAPAFAARAAWTWRH